jgi:hypothetical protein
MGTIQSLISKKKDPQRCIHKRIKKNYPFGKKSKPFMYCKDCGKPIRPKEKRERRISMKRRSHNGK